MLLVQINRMPSDKKGYKEKGEQENIVGHCTSLAVLPACKFEIVLRDHPLPLQCAFENCVHGEPPNVFPLIPLSRLAMDAFQDPNVTAVE